MRWMVIVALIGTVGCGIPIDDEPEALDVELGDPVELVAPIVEDLSAASMYLVRGDGVVPVTRDLPTPLTLEEVVESLLEGASDPESRSNLRTSIPAGTELLGIEENDGLAIVDLSRRFAAVGGEAETLAVAQVVLTVTGFEGVDRVLFELDGVPTGVPTPGGALSDDPLVASDYTELVRS